MNRRGVLYSSDFVRLLMASDSSAQIARDMAEVSMSMRAQERRTLVAEVLKEQVGMHPRDEYRLCSEEYDALYRANGARARGRRRGLRFRMAELLKDPRVNEREPMTASDVDRERVLERGRAALGAIVAMAAMGRGGFGR